jgi:hypothetical protein
MPRYFFRIRNGRYSGASEHGVELADHNAAWAELTRSCANIVSGICRKLVGNGAVGRAQTAGFPDLSRGGFAGRPIESRRQKTAASC